MWAIQGCVGLWVALACFVRGIYPSLSPLCRHWRHPSEFCYGLEADLRRSAPPSTRPSSRHWCGDKSRRQLPPGTCAGTRQGATADVGPILEHLYEPEWIVLGHVGGHCRIQQDHGDPAGLANLPQPSSIL